MEFENLKFFPVGLRRKQWRNSFFFTLNKNIDK